MRPERAAPFPGIGRLSPGPALGLAVAVLSVAVLYGGFAEQGFPPPVCLLLAGSGLVPPVLWRRRHLVPALCAAVAVPAVTAAVTGRLVTWLFLPTAVALYRVAADGRSRTSGAAVCAVAAVLAADGLAGRPRDRPGAQTASIIMLMAMAWGIGRLVRLQRITVVQQRARASAEERLRIAREMHDIVAHSMSVIAVQASFGHYVIDSRPDEAAAALSVIETASREALTEIRGVLGALRQGEGSEDEGAGPPAEAPLGPAPGLAQLDHLLARTADAGVDAALDVRGRPRRLPPGIDLSAYRIVQEALANVVRHSGATRCRIQVHYRPDELLIDVTDNGTAQPAPRTGHGLIGMRERVDLHRGRFAAGPHPDGGFQVTARIPVPGDAR